MVAKLQLFHAKSEPYSIACYNLTKGMTGFDGGGCRQTASREAPNSQNQRKHITGKSKAYNALPLAA